MRSQTRRRLVAFVFAIGAAAVVAAPVAAHDPIPTGTKRNFGGATNVTYRRVSSPGTWFNTNVATALETNFRASSANNSRVPTLSYSSTGAGDVVYKNASSSPCGSGNTAWLQCASNPGADANWTIYVRDLTTGGPSGWTWWEVGSTCGTHGSTCWYLRRALIHELGHAMLAFPDMCLGSQPCRSESDTVMNSHDPEVGTTGSTHFTYQRCDEAAAQLDWGMFSSSGEVGDCFDHITGHGTYGLVVDLSASPSSVTACAYENVTIAGRLQIHTNTNYGHLSAQGLASRTIWIDRGTTSKYTSASTSTSSGNNWSKTFSGSNVTFSYVAHFDKPSGQGLDASPQRAFTITWLSPQVAC